MCMCVYVCERMEENKDLRRCEKCSSLQTYIRLSTKERVCRRCGHIGEFKEDENAE